VAVPKHRSIALAAAFGVALAATGWVVLEGLGRAGVGQRSTLLDRVGAVLLSVQAATRRSPESWKVVVVGDSHMMGSGGIPFHGWLERALWEQRDDAVVQRVATHGLSLFAHFCLSDRIAETAPHAIVMELDLADLSRLWRDASDAPFVGLLEPRRWPEAVMLPLGRAGVSMDQLLLYGSIVRFGGFQRWRWLQGEQARVALATWSLERALQRHTLWPEGTRYHRDLELAGVVEERVAGRRRASPDWVHATLGPALEGASRRHPALRFFEAALRHYAEAGVPVFVFVNPVNVEHLRALGLSTEGLARSIAHARALAVGQGAGFADLHALLPDAAFGDEMDHLDAESDGPRQLGSAVAEALLAWARPGAS
jgi:hypothetical protein